eukprot:Gregarina_sp_Pseudo_9__5794@NODE_870_length_2119_cov_6_750000_g818_i0_p1_GENE_NODE_870_length_2119_cov_6_750000_g818_i0NODE_870_length_2119_cov_6_750000_g818_i0_p1_ORF_typecomplete_len607_score144_39UBA_4/PF14555_6/1_8e07SMC_N/PF02463_19/0_0004MAP7/PF05672_11/0_41DUF572/PF04502_13/1_1Borrelia_P83/PF05262_11/1_4DUF3464/PF11947_8/13Selenoprotein_S/PF06936_11/13_NODE_870_length_2119_cov_6_750000_g818_i0471867
MPSSEESLHPSSAEEIDAEDDIVTSGTADEARVSTQRNLIQQNPALVQQLEAITGLPTAAARDLLAGVGGNLKTAVDLFFDNQHEVQAAPTTPLLARRDDRQDTPTVSALRLQPTLPPASIATRCRTLAEYLVEQTSKILSLAMSSFWLLLNGLIRPIGNANFGLSFDASFRRLLLTSEDGSSVTSNFTFPSSSLVQVMPVACSSLKPIFAFIMNSAALGSVECSNLRQVCSMVMTAELQHSLNEETCLLGFDPKASLSNRLHCRILQLDQNTPLSICVILPLVLSTQLTAQFRRMLNPTGTPPDLMSYHPLTNDLPSIRGNTLSVAEAETAFVAIQSKFVALADSDQVPALGEFRLNILRNGCIQCYTLALTPQHAVDPILLRMSLRQAVSCAAALIEPIRELRCAETARREADRRLIAEQQREYEESLAADRARARERREAEARKKEEEAAREQARAAEEKREVDRISGLRAKANDMLSAESLPENPEEVFADILLRMASSNERFRLRVHKDIKYGAVLEVVSCVEFMMETANAVLWVRPGVSVSSAVSCRVHKAGTTRSPKPPPVRGYTVAPAMAAGVKLDPALSVEECGLLPNAVLHVTTAV